MKKALQNRRFFVTVQLLVSITRFVVVGGESWGYGSRRG
jgi:hypothetical protein